MDRNASCAPAKLLKNIRPKAEGRLVDIQKEFTSRFGVLLDRAFHYEDRLAMITSTGDLFVISPSRLTAGGSLRLKVERERHCIDGSRQPFARRCGSSGVYPTAGSKFGSGKAP